MPYSLFDKSWRNTWPGRSWDLAFVHLEKAFGGVPKEMMM